MKGKVLLSSLVTLSLAVSSYGVALADTTSGEFQSSSDNGSVFSWNYNGGGYLGVYKSTHSYPNPYKDWADIAGEVTNMSISSSSASNTTPYTYSYFKDGMTKLKSLSVNDSCRFLKINNYCPNLETITINNNYSDYITINLTGRKSISVPQVNIYGSTVKSVSLDLANTTEVRFYQCLPVMVKVT